MSKGWFVALAAGVWMACGVPSLAASTDSDVTLVASAPVVLNALSSAATDTIPPPLTFVRQIQICPEDGCNDPPQPLCAGDSIRVYVGGEFPSACYSLLDIDLFYPPWAASTRPGFQLVPWVRIVYRDDLCIGRCPWQPVPFGAWLTLPPVPPGTYPLTVMEQPVGCDSLARTSTPAMFTVGNACDSVPPNPLPYVDRVAFCRTEGPGPCGPICPTDSIVAIISGTFPNDCYGVTRVELLPSIAAVYPPNPSVLIVVDNNCCLGRPCNPQPQPWSASIKLPPMPSGTHPVFVSIAEVCCSDSVPPIPLPTAQFPVAVAAGCPVLPFLHSVLLCGDARADSGGVIPCEPLCRGDSIAVILSGILPNDCYEVLRVDIVPPPPSFREAAPSLRVVIDNQCCRDRLCLPNPRSWHRVVKLPPMSAGPYNLAVSVAELCCSDWVPPGSIWPEARFAFTVDTCDVPPPPSACLWGGWFHPNGNGNCDAFLSNGSATVGFTVNSTTALAGLEGDFHLGYPRVLPALGPPVEPPVITSIVPIGVASGMHLRWTATRGGARFVLFAADGAPIPASPPFTGDPVAVLAVTVGMPAGVRPPGDIGVYHGNLLGADASGNGVPICPVRDIERIAVYPARICTSVDCDFNHDGLANIRDLVTMVRCLRSSTCSNTGQFDCDADGGFDLDDVLCCAWTVLRPPPCAGCPGDTTPPRKDEGVRLVLDAVESAAGEARAGLRIDGADRVGGVRLEFRFPSDRYEFAGLDGIGNDWLALTDVSGDAIVVGLIRLGEVDGALAAQSATCSGTLRLRLKSGMSPGGDLTTVGAEFSGTDGARLEVAPNSGPLALAPGMAFALSDNRPDPFTGSTRFSLTLPQAADADLGVFDVGGRRVATVHRGPLAAGVSEFAWDGTFGNGGRVASGVYFYRATVAGRTLSKKMVVLGD